MEPKITSYAGMLDQSDFKQWYKYVDFRIAYQYTSEEVSFLMSKPPFYFSDYEVISSASRLTADDLGVLSGIFSGSMPKQLELNEDDFGLFEKRIVRVRRVEEPKQICFAITIPWTIKKGQKSIKFHEQKRRINIAEMAEIRLRIQQTLDRLFKLGYFRCGRTALDIYRTAEERCRFSPILRPLYVKEGLYRLINAGSLTLKMKNDYLRFQEPHLDHPVFQESGLLFT
ncbi:hypothetical protein [Parapedobacter tibetensis]|uniref:hypothetical protein n=1 Tax=Parapedobacter tibetensis TaxID=2972951 RepID=UPI00214D8A16|nr:hypothetical protein [Parapedobacter tibetensis]